MSERESDTYQNGLGYISHTYPNPPNNPVPPPPCHGTPLMIILYNPPSILTVWVFTMFGNRAACYRIEKRETPANSWGGCWEECWGNSGCWTECWQGCCEGGGSFGKEWGAALSPALPPAPRISPALFPAPSPAIFWGSPFLYSVAGRPVPNTISILMSYRTCSSRVGRGRDQAASLPAVKLRLNSNFNLV